MFIAGSSMGALFAAHACLAQQSWFSGLLLWSPSIDVDKTPVMHVQSLLGGPLEALVPWARIVEAVRVNDMSEDPQVNYFASVSCAFDMALMFSCILHHISTTSETFWHRDSLAGPMMRSCPCVHHMH